MKGLKILILTLILATASFAQTKIGIVNGYLFYDEKVGIQKLIQAVKLTYDDDFVTPRLAKRIEELKTEIEKLKTLSKPIENEVLELSRLEKEMKKIRDTVEKRRSILLRPIENQIKDKLKLFETKRGYTKILDLSDDKILNAILYVDESIDVTNKFIKFCNEEFEKEKHKVNE